MNRTFPTRYFNLFALALLVVIVGWKLSVRSNQIDTLKGKQVPLPENLDDFVKDRAAAIQLGKALFWDMQLGSDGVQTCASCHFNAGADNRVKNQMSPAGKDHPDRTFSFGGPNFTLQAFDFPLNKEANEVVSSQGVYHAIFLGADPGAGQDNVDPQPDPTFNVNGLNTRAVEPRNTPTIINSIFGFRGLWDSRANNQFNGNNPFGPRDQNAKIWIKNGSTVWEERVLLSNAAMASVAVGPPTDFLEVGSIARTWPFIGKRLLTAKPLKGQEVDPSDSHLAYIRDNYGKGLTGTYEDLIKRAFRDKLWSDNPVAWRVDGFNQTVEFSQTEDNFSFFAGVSMMMYLSTQVSDESRFDDYAQGNHYALSTQEQAGLDVFLNKGRCVDCHAGPDLTNAGFNLQAKAAQEALVNTFRRRDGKVALFDRGSTNIGVRKFDDDQGQGRNDDFGNDLSFAEQHASNDKHDPFWVDPTTFDVPLANQPVVAIEGAFKTPGLRNIGLTAPYMHNGGFATLRQVVDFFDRGGDFTQENAAFAHPAIQPLYLSDYEKDALVAFMLTLTDERVRMHRAPFDHPQILVPDGHTGNQAYVVDDGSGQAVTDFIDIPAVGRYGYSSLPSVLRGFHENIGLTHFDGTPGAGDQADLAIFKRFSDTAGTTVGDAVLIEIQVTNAGPGAAPSVIVTDDLPASLEYGWDTEVASQGQVSVHDGQVTWEVGEIWPGEMAMLSFRATVKYPYYGTITNTAEVRHGSAVVDPYPTNNSSTATFEALVPMQFPPKVQIQAGTFWRDGANNVHPVVGTYNRGVYRGLPPGQTSVQLWVEANEGLPNPVIVNDAITTAANDIYIATWGYEGVYKSTDGGRTWKGAIFHDETGLTTGSLIVYAIEEGPDGTLYASADRGRIFRSLDGGGTWHFAGELPGASSDVTWALAAHPTKPGFVFAGTFGNGVFATDNYGLTWSRLEGRGLGDDGRIQVFDIEFDPATPEKPTLWAATARGVYRSMDLGGNWQELNGGLYPFREARSLAFHPDSDGPVFAAVWGGGVYKLTNRKHNTVWEFVDMDGANVTTVFYEPTSGSLAAGTASAGFTLMSVGAAATDIDPEVLEVPVSMALDQNFPNPFNPTTNISFELSESSKVRLAVYDVLGREMRVLSNSQLTAGRHEISFDASGLPSGTYLYRLDTAQGSFTRTMSLLK
ncbi:MAG: putative repeat protein (TIGR01451 family) [Thalassolituus oleivorans]|jgi:uncharacterized repeat protein (TIGR01451 family)